MHLEYLQDDHTFHVERIMDFLSHSLPICALHQSRTILFFCYAFAIFLEFLLYPPYSIGNTPFGVVTLFIPMIVVTAFHILLTIIYFFGAIFERASCKTASALLFLLHAAIPLSVLIGIIVLVNQKDPNYLSGFCIIGSIAIFLDFLCGVISRPSQRVILTFELFSFASFLLGTLYFNNIIQKKVIPFIPIFAFFAIYIIFLLFLLPFCGVFRSCTIRTLSDPEIKSEFTAAMDPQLKPFKTRTDWAEDTDILGSEIEGRREGRNRWERDHAAIPENITRFPSRAHFQLYNIDATPENPLYLASPLPIFATFLLILLIFIEWVHPIANFYFWLIFVAALIIISILINSRATSCSFMSVTNLDEKCVDILWDHPSLSVL